MNLLEEQNGRHWGAAKAASCDPADAADYANLGAGARAFSFRACATVAIEDAGIRAGEIIGFRAWAVERDGTLRSMYADHRWTPGTTEEGGLEYYGIHAFKTLKQAVRHYSCYSVASPVVFGEVALWGDVIEHEYGFRGQYGAIVSLRKIKTTFSPYRFIGRRWWEFWKPSTLNYVRRRYGLALKTAN